MACFNPKRAEPRQTGPAKLGEGKSDTPTILSGILPPQSLFNLSLFILPQDRAPSAKGERAGRINTERGLSILGKKNQVQEKYIVYLEMNTFSAAATP